MSHLILNSARVRKQFLHQVNNLNMCSAASFAGKARSSTKYCNLQTSMSMHQFIRGLSSTVPDTMSKLAAELKPTLKPKYYIPVAKRSCPSEVFKPDHEGRVYRPNRTSPSRDMNFTPEHWERHKSPWRRIHHITSIFRSSPFQRLIMPDLAITSAVATALTYYNIVIAPDMPLHVDGSAMSGATTAVGLLAAFRMNASYGRYDEGRKFWGEINNSSRDLAGNAMMWISNKGEKERMLRMIKAFPVSVHWHLNYKGSHYELKRADPQFEDQRYAEYYEEMKSVFDGNPEDEDFLYIMQNFKDKTHLPLRISATMRAIIAANDADPIYNREMDEQVQRLVGCLGMAERVLRTPMPLCFTRHTSRIFFLWSNLLPFALYPALGPFLHIPASLMVSYSVMGIGDIGVQLEEPFNILPLRQYSEGIADGVNNIKASYETQSIVSKSMLGTGMTNISQNSQ